MRKVTAGTRASFVDHALRSIQKDAAAFGVPQHPPGRVFRVWNRVVPDYVRLRELQVFRDCGEIKIRQGHLCLTAAISTVSAINLFRNGSGEDPKRPVRIVVGVQKPLESKIFRVMDFCKPVDLDQIREHALQHTPVFTALIEFLR